ncbi:BfmA/BtgA family mobilization protein [Mesonia ostreae]|uniref:BfmA/BtgA family mobilization protein n=1 Tax=Mesonia ostreae TaxID=861110 RepID=A0ABU2KKK1_9FLAO|nr:BfmA/BtgA family mobilization protein [Mesonia ostreae]MDT0295179.1 BfmA/BtgA family mobilization protein [Mesonia ostreae]
MTKKSILISPYHHKELKKLSEAFGLNFYKLIEEMIIYFKKTGINPSDPKNENPSKGLRELDKRMVSFLKVQERDILKPLRQEVYNYSQERSEETQIVFKNLMTTLNTMNQYEKKRTDLLLSEIKNQREVMIAILELIDSKNKSGIMNIITKKFK